MIPGNLLSAFPHRQFHTLPGLLDSWAALPNSYPNACMPMQGGSLYHFYDGLWYDPAERRTHDLPCERLTRYRLSQPDTVLGMRSPRQGAWVYVCVRVCTCVCACVRTWHEVPWSGCVTQMFLCLLATGICASQSASVSTLMVFFCKTSGNTPSPSATNSHID